MENAILHIRELLMKDLKEFVDIFDATVSRKSRWYGRGKAIEARYSTYGGDGFYMDYYCLYPVYSKETAREALKVFKEYTDIITLMLDALKIHYPSVEYTIGKTEASSSRIGKELYVEGLPFELDRTYYCTWDNRMERRK